jgi:hypothetical protein
VLRPPDSQLRRGARVAALALVILASPVASAGARVPSGNLLANPGAEQAGSPLPHWTPGGSFILVNYGTGAYPSRAIGDGIAGGCGFFTGGQQGSVTGRQEIDLSHIPEIASPGVTATVSGELGGFETQEDNARVEVTYESAGNPVGAPLTIGPVTAAERGGRTGFVARRASGQVPPSADKAFVTVTLTRVGAGSGSEDNDGYADNLGFTLDGSVPGPPPTACLPDRDGDGFAQGSDCDDTNPAIHPGAAEVPDDGIDQDCDGADAVNLDRDHDGFNRPQDCDDANPGVHPGAEDRPGDGIDADCRDGDAPFPKILSPITAHWDADSEKGTRVTALLVKDVPAAGSVLVTCSGRGCPFRRLVPRVAHHRASATRRFGHHRLAPGVHVEVRITAPGSIGKVVRYAVRGGGRLPKSTQLCLPPGASRPTRCG